MEIETIIELNRKLIGNIKPVGESHIDSVNWENLKTQAILIDSLLTDFVEIAGMKDRHEYSIKKAGEYANEILDNLENYKL